MNQVVKKDKQEVAEILDWKSELGEIAAETKETDVMASNVIGCMDAEFTLGDDTFTEFSAIVLDSAHIHAFYTSGYDPDSVEPPACFAVGLARDDTVMAPSADCPVPSAKGCDTCKKNEFGTADTGKGKACNQRRRLLLVAVEDAEKMDAGKLEASDVAVIHIPVTSVKNWRSYLTHLRKVEKVLPQQVVTAFKIEKDKKTRHKVTFDISSQIGDELMPTVMEIRRDNLDELMREPDFTGYGEDEPEDAAIAAKV